MFFFLGRMRFIRNYWDDKVELGPYKIIGEIFVSVMDPWAPEDREKIFDWTFFDWFPARKPYDIEV
jgi:hypothetical protein